VFVKACFVTGLTLIFFGMFGCILAQEKFRSEGTIVVVKDKPYAPACLLQTNDGNFYRVSGAKAKGLLSLPGARVLLEGKLNPSSPYKELVVSRYTILNIGGKQPIVGVLLREGKGFKLKTQSLNVLSLNFGRLTKGLPEAGTTLWVIGSVQGDTVVVERFGVLGE
jgi:hypothetical protein